MRCDNATETFPGLHIYSLLERLGILDQQQRYGSMNWACHAACVLDAVMYIAILIPLLVGHLGSTVESNPNPGRSVEEQQLGPHVTLGLHYSCAC